MLNSDTFEKILNTNIETEPFNHIVIDNFFEENYANSLEQEFPAYDDQKFYRYENAIENKRAMNVLSSD